ncbi:MAG: porin family protein [Muribaculaceae bacterium]|nr:porin family protein [Muribaculaceae bacterium]
MKKLFLPLIAAAALVLPASAQNVNLYASYGGYTQMDACDCHDGWSGVNTAWGAVNVGVDFGIGSRFRIGPSYTFSSATTKGGPNHSDLYYHAILMNAKYDYYRTGILALYAHVGLGVEISHLAPKFSDSYNKTYFAGQISPIGARVQLGSGFNFFGELGFGAQGLAQFGFSYDF